MPVCAAMAERRKGFGALLCGLTVEDRTEDGAVGRSGFMSSKVLGAGVAGPASAAKRLPFVISTADDLRALTVSPKVFRRLPPSGVIVALPGVDETAQQAFRQEIGRYARACGCSAGAVTFLLATASLAVCVILLIHSHAWMPAIEAAVAGIIVVLLLTVSSKALSISLAGWRFRRRCAQMLEIFLAGSTHL